MKEKLQLQLLGQPGIDRPELCQGTAALMRMQVA
jgi:hypothetical protein